MEELTTTEQLELQQEKETREKLKLDISLGKDLEKLRKNRAFKNVVENMFIKQGKSILWQNIQILTEEQLKGRGSDKNLEIIEAIKGQVKSRLDFEGFMDTVENDYAMALEEQAEMERE